jgi:hypothetical protein
VGGVDRDRVCRLLVELESEDLAEAQNATVLQHGIAADL